MLKIETNICVCGKRATRDYSDIVDVVEEVIRVGDERVIRIEYKKLCEKCYGRVKELSRRFDFVGGIYYIVEYIRERDMFIIRARNEYGDSAVLSENWRHTRKTLRNPYTRETIFMEGDRIIGVF